jgi:hypothetical protein
VISYIDGVPISRSPKADFMTIMAEQAKAYMYFCPGASRQLLVFIAVVNACQSFQSRTVKLHSSWYTRLGVSRSAGRKHLKRLRDAGVIAIAQPKGCMPVITLSELVPLRRIN